MNRLVATSWAAAALVAACVPVAPAAEPAAPPLPAKKLSFRDIQLTVHARQALADDPVLGPANLGVRVQDNVAVLWGPAPSEDAKRRAVVVVKKVKGVFEVRDADVYVAAPVPAVETPADPPPAPPTRTESDLPGPASDKGAALTARPGDDPPSVPLVVLRPPLPAVESGPDRTTAAAPPAAELAAAVEQVRRGEPRFNAVDCRLDGDVVLLRPGAGRGEDVMAFARALLHLPGLSRVVIWNDDGAQR